MSTQAVAALTVVGVWWLSTAAVLFLVWQSPKTHRAILLVSGVLALAALGGVCWANHVETATGAYASFVGAIVIWAWHELSFLLGVVTGPHKDPCPPDARGWRRFRLATATLIHHELALAGTVALLTILSWAGSNRVGLWTFVVLWIMRLSAKFNVYLGVRNVTEEFVPERLRYLVSYFRRARLNPLMPVSLLGSMLVTTALIFAAVSTTATPFAAVAHSLIGTLLALAALEHLFLATPLPDAALWRWAIPVSRRVRR